MCNCATGKAGKAGKGDGSLYIGDIGPLCPDCHAIFETEFSALEEQLTAALAENKALRAFIVVNGSRGWMVRTEFLPASFWAGPHTAVGGFGFFDSEAAAIAAVKEKVAEAKGGAK